MTSVQAPLRRIAVHTAGSKVDLVVPVGGALGHALAVAGVQLAPGDQVYGPGGTAVDPLTSASDLVEGGLYSVASGRAVTGDDERASHAHSGPRMLSWAIVASGLAAGVIAVLQDDLMWQWIAAAIVALAALIVALVCGTRSNTKSGPLDLAPGLLLGAIAGVLCAPSIGAGVNAAMWDAMFAIALGFAGVAVIAVLLSATARAATVRAGSTTIAVLSALAAVLAAVSPLVEWGPQQFAIALSAASVLAIRALPALLVNADDGYFIDYSKFMSLRWTVRGRVPRYVELVDNAQVREMVAVTEFRLRAALLMLSVLAVPGIASAVLQLTGGSLTERIGAGVFLILSIVGLLLISRRTVAPMLKRPQRIAALAGVLSAVLVLAVSNTVPETALLAAAGVLALAAALVAVGSLALQRGAQSLGWSRTGDIVEAITVMFVLPAGLIAAGAIDVLRGVLS